MKRLPTEFTESGFIHKQVYREGNLAVFIRKKVGSGRCHFEAVRIKSHNGFTFPGAEKATPPAEYYPNTKSWGVDGYTLPTLAESVAKLSAFSQKIQPAV